jgi:hypothetical protein
MPEIATSSGPAILHWEGKTILIPRNLFIWVIVPSCRKKLYTVSRLFVGSSPSLEEEIA